MKILQVGKTDKNFYAKIDKLQIQFYTAELLLLKLDQFGFSEGLTYYINENEINDVATLINFVRFYSKSCELKEEEMKEANDFLDTLDLKIDKIDRIFPWNKKIIKEVQEFVGSNYITRGTREYVAALIQRAKEKWPKKLKTKEKGSTEIDGLLTPQEVSEMTGLALKSLSQRRWKKQPPTYVRLNVKENKNKKMVFYNVGSVLEFMKSKNILKKIKKRLAGISKKSLHVESSLYPIPIAPQKEIILPYFEETFCNSEMHKEPLNIKILDNAPIIMPMSDYNLFLGKIDCNSEFQGEKLSFEPRFKELENRIKELETHVEERDDKLQRYIDNRNNSIKKELYTYNEKIQELNRILDYRLSTDKKNMYDYIDERLKIVLNSDMEIRIKIGDLEEKINEMYFDYLTKDSPTIDPSPKGLRQILDEIPEKEKLLLTPVTNCEFSVRSFKCFKNNNLIYWGDVVQKSERELLRIRNLGRMSLNQIKWSLGQYDLQLGIDLPDWWATHNIKELSKLYMRDGY
jgi:hypothetical protein